MKLWNVLIVGLIIGLAGGLVYAWALAPVEYADTYPPFLRKDFRADWSRMTLLAYAVEGNWNRTQIRLQDIQKAEVQQIAIETLNQAIADGQPLDRLQRLARLAAFYGVDTPAVSIYASDSAVAPTPIASPPSNGSETTIAPTWRWPSPSSAKLIHTAPSLWLRRTAIAFSLSIRPPSH